MMVRLPGARRLPLMVLLLPSLALAHGGAYVGPAGSGGAAADASTAAPPASNPGGAGAVPLPGGAPASSAPAPGSGGARGASGRAPSGSGRQALESGPAADSWEFWWEANRDGFLALKHRRFQAVQPAGSTAWLTGRGAGRAWLAQRPDAARIGSEIVPALLEVSASADDRDVLDSTLIALGRSAPPDGAGEAAGVARGLLAHPELTVQGAAALALGMLGDPGDGLLLRQLLRDQAAGRQAVGGGPVPPFVRASAAIGLGLLGGAQPVHDLLSAAMALPDSERDVKACTLAALGLLPAGAPAAPVVSAALLGLIEQPGLDPALASCAASSLGKLGDRRAVPGMVALLADTGANILLRRALAMALGRLASMDDADALAALRHTVRHDSDAPTRHFALLSLAAIGARDEAPTRHAAAQQQLAAMLLDELGGGGRSAGHRSWAALGAAILGRGQPATRESLLGALRRAFAHERDPAFRGAFAMALALLDDHASAADLHAAFRDSHQDDFRGYAGVALGLLRHRPAADELLALCADKTIAPTFRVKLATGLGLMGDRRAVPVLLERLAGSATLDGLAGSARALGLVGDSSALPSLLALARDEDARPATRAFACVALGLIGERGALPFNAPLREDFNYFAQTPALAEVLRIL